MRHPALSVLRHFAFYSFYLFLLLFSSIAIPLFASSSFYFSSFIPFAAVALSIFLSLYLSCTHTEIPLQNLSPVRIIRTFNSTCYPSFYCKGCCEEFDSLRTCKTGLMDSLITNKMTNSQSHKYNCRGPEESPAEKDEAQEKDECVYVFCSFY